MIASGHQRSVVGLVALHGRLRLGLNQLGLRGLERGFAALQLGAADEVLVFELFVALEVSRRQIAVGLGRSDLGPGGIGGQLVVLRIELRQHLAGLHTLAQLGLALDDLAADPKAQPGLDLRPDLTGILVGGGKRGGAHRDHLDRTNRLLWRGGFGAGGQQNSGTDQGEDGFFHGLTRMRNRHGAQLAHLRKQNSKSTND